VVAHRQLIDLGIRRRAIQHRLAVGRLQRIHFGVYAVGHWAIDAHGRLMAAVLACGTDAVASHFSAAWLWDLKPPSRTGGVDVTVTGRSRRRRAGIVLHQVRRLEPADRAVREGIPVTGVARTLLDLAEVLPQRQLRRVFEEAERLRLFDLREMEELCQRSHGRRGLRPLRAVLAEAVTPVPSRSELERAFLEFCSGAGLPQPAVNAVVAGFEADMSWAKQRLIVELDSYAHHGTRAAFERDRAKDATFQLAGYRVLRVTHRRLEREPAAVAEVLRALLQA
jgi:hypothetical protein